MKKNRHILAVLLTLMFLIGGVQTALAQTDPAPTRGNAAPSEMLPEDLKGMDVKDYYIEAAGRPAGSIRTVIGHVVVLHEDTGQAYFAAAGDAIFKHDVVFTLKDSRCRLKFTTDDIITMGDNARIGIEEYIDDRVQKKKTSIFSMLRGKAMFYALRLFKYRTSSSSVKTPTAIIGVRGTQFGVEVVKTDQKIAASKLPIYLADASGSGLQNLLAQSGPSGGPAVIVRAHVIFGAVDVTPQPGPGLAPPGPAPPPIIVNAGQSVEATPDQISPPSATPPGVLSAFIGATNVPDPEATLDEGQKPAPPPAAAGTAPVAGDTGAADPTDTGVTDKNQDLIQNTTTIAQETQGTPVQGYFTGMLTDQDSSPYLDNVYVSSSLQDFNSTLIRADGLFSSGGFIDGNPDAGFVYTNPTLKQVAVESGLVSADNLNLPVTKSSLGSNDYMDWGYWYVANTFIINSIVHDLWHKGYYIAGYPTPDANVAGISGTYSGPAYGTYYNATGSAPQGIDMTGTFSCDVNGSAGTISNFAMSVSGGGRSASISGASGTLNSSSFDISGGTWVLFSGVSYDPDYKSCHGSLYGPNGEHIGGAWGMKENSSNGAEGIFQGNKQ